MEMMESKENVSNSHVLQPIEKVMKTTFLFLLFSCVGFGSSTSWAQQSHLPNGTTVNVYANGQTGPANAQGQQAGQNQNSNQAYIQRGCEAICQNQEGCAAGNPKSQCDCTITNASDTQQSICVSNAKLLTCQGNILASGSCPSKSNNSDVDSNGLTTELGRTCQGDTNTAQTTCDPNKSQDVGAVMQMATGAQQALSMATGSSIQAACGTLGKVSAAASAATATYKGYCSYSYSQCQKSCQAALDADTAAIDSASKAEIPQIKKLQKQCNGMQQNIAEASNAILGLIGEKINMQQCASLTTDCTLNPTSAACLATADCTNATTAATNVVCICQANPMDSRCGGGSNVAGGGGLGGAPALSSTSSTTDGTLGKFGLDSNGQFGAANAPIANAEQQQPQNMAQGMQGGHNLGSTGSVNNAYTPPGAAGAAGSKASILSGYYGGTGGGGFGSSGGSGSGNGNGGYRPGGAGSGKSGLDLKQFLPGGANDPARGIAGISGPDGITGPNSDIWQKVNTRYFSVSHTLLP